MAPSVKENFQTDNSPHIKHDDYDDNNKKNENDDIVNNVEDEKEPKCESVNRESLREALEEKMKTYKADKSFCKYNYNI